MYESLAWCVGLTVGQIIVWWDQSCPYSYDQGLAERQNNRASDWTSVPFQNRRWKSPSLLPWTLPCSPCLQLAMMSLKNGRLSGTPYTPLRPNVSVLTSVGMLTGLTRMIKQLPFSWMQSALLITLYSQTPRHHPRSFVTSRIVQLSNEICAPWKTAGLITLLTRFSLMPIREITSPSTTRSSLYMVLANRQYLLCWALTPKQPYLIEKASCNDGVNISNTSWTILPASQTSHWTGSNNTRYVNIWVSHQLETRYSVQSHLCEITNHLALTTYQPRYSSTVVAHWLIN